jgi:uncharacterized protein (DUF58 family)
MRWLMLVLLVIGLTLTFTARGAGLLALGLVLGFVGLFGLIFALAADRVSASARPDSAMVGSQEYAALRARGANIRPASPQPAVKPPAPPAGNTKPQA